MRLTEHAHAAVREVLQPGEAAIDATAGNGHDTRFLSEIVGPTGHVFAFDIQPEAIARTAAWGLTNVTLFRRTHADLASAIPMERHGRIGAVMFNLGYLPGGDKSVRTVAESTEVALRAGFALLRPGGILSVVAYTGHAGGEEELAAIERVLAGHDVRVVDSEPGSVAGPRLFIARRAGE